MYGLLLHRSEQLLGLDGKVIFQALQHLKETGLVQKIGISIYSPGELDALKKVTVTFFSNYDNKDGNKITYKDQKLCDLLMGFTRVTEQVVSKNFWIKNENVMQAVYELINATSMEIKAKR